LKNPQANGECGVINNFAFGTPNLTVSWDPRASTGWGVREYNNQWSLSAQQEIRAGWAVSAGFYHTDWQNGQVAVNTAVAATDFDSYCITAPSDSRLGNVSGQQVCGLTNVNFAQKSTAPKTVWMRPQDVAGLSGQRTDVYNGFDLSMNTRFRQSGVLAGGISVGREVTNNCFANAFPNVTGYVSAGASSAFGNRDPKYCETKSPLWQGVGSQVKFQVVYPLKYDFVVSGTYKNLPGIPITATITVPDAAVAASLGRNLSACAAPTGACTQVASVSVVYPQSVFDRRLNEVDSRLSRRFKLGKTRVNGVIELYNVFNARTPQANVSTWGTLATPVSAAAPAASYLRPSAFLGGRLLKFGFQFDL
jgi:hypothetical protein